MILFTMLMSVIMPTMATALTYSLNVVSNLEELQTALNNDSFTEVIINNAITLPNGTILDGKGKTVRVEKPYVKENGQLEESPSTTRVFTIENSSNITIKNMTIMGGEISGSAAISSNGNLTMENVNVVRSNRGLDNYGGITILKKCNFSLNVGQSAGAIWSGNGAKIILDGCSFTQNRSNGGSGYGGGAIGVSGAYLYANNTIFANNSTQEIGGAINIYGGNVYLMNCTVAGNCTTKSSSCGGGIGKNGGVFHAVNSVFIDNYAKISGDKVRSDIGIYGGSDGTLNNCVYSKIQGSMSSTINCKVDESNTTASTYTDNGIILSDGSTSASFSHPVLTTGTNSYSKYVIIKNSGNAATGGINTYYDYSDTSNIKMGYGNDSSITALGGLTTPASDKKVTTYYEGGARVYGVIGASGADGDTTVTYSVTVTNDGNGTAEANPTSGETGTEVTLTATPKNSDYRFKEWQVISGGVTINDNKFTIGSSDVEVKAIFEEVTLNEYTVRFMDGETELSSQTITEGGHATRPTTDPTKDGYTFDDWYLDSTFTTKFNFETTAITADTIIYAGYTKETWIDETVDESLATIISEVNIKETLTGEETTEEIYNNTVSTTYSSDASSTEIAEKLTQARTDAENYMTDNGYTNKGATNTTSVDRTWDNRRYDAVESSYSSTEHALITIHHAQGGYGKETTYKVSYSAEYTKQQFTVSFMDGTNEINSQTVIDGQKIARPTTNPTKANHEFVNWYADSTYTTIFDFNTTIEGNMCIYAKFNPVYHDVTISLSDGLVISSEEQFTEEQTLGIEFLVEKGLIIIEEDNEADVERWYDKDRKLLFTYDENTSTVHFADGITYKDNINYTLTDEDKELLVGYGVYASSFILSFEEPPFEYKILEGANQTHTVNEDGSLTVKANGELSKFVKLLVDRKEVPEKDRTIVSGSTIATLSKDYLDKLSEGTHELTFVYTDGEILTNFTIAKVNTPTGTTEDDTTSNVPVTTPEVTEEETKTSNSPKTGDNITVWISLILLSSLGIFVTYKYLRKRV